jgi:hypothetical protein
MPESKSVTVYVISNDSVDLHYWIREFKRLAEQRGHDTTDKSYQSFTIQAKPIDGDI